MQEKITNFLARLVNQKRRTFQDTVPASVKQNLNKLNINLGSVQDPKIEIKEKDALGVQEIKNPSSAQLVEELKKDTCTLFFYKQTNGQFRRMVCTLKGREPIPNICNRPGVIVVWDLEHNNWRSFYPNRVFKLIRNETTTVQ